MKQVSTKSVSGKTEKGITISKPIYYVFLLHVGIGRDGMG